MRISVIAVAGLLCFPAVGVVANGVTDAQIASIVVTANQVDIDAGKLARSRSTNVDVKTFAELMVTDHTGVNKSAVDLAGKLKVTPQDNPTSQSLKAGETKTSPTSRRSVAPPSTRRMWITRSSITSRSLTLSTRR